MRNYNNKAFNTKNRENHHNNSIREKESIIRFFEQKKISYNNCDTVIWDTTGYNVKDNHDEYIIAGFSDISLYCVELEKKICKDMQNMKQRYELNNVHIIHGELFNSILKSERKVKHINYDGTKSLYTLISNGLYRDLERVLASGITTHAFTFQLLYDVAQTVVLYKYKSKHQIIAEYLDSMEKLAKSYGYGMKTLYSDRFKGSGRIMQSIVIGFYRIHSKKL